MKFCIIKKINTKQNDKIKMKQMQEKTTKL